MGRRRGIQYRPGSFYRSDDRSGFARRAEDTQEEWNHLIVGKNLWEARQPQDFVRGVPDNQTVPNPRPAPPPIFTGPLYTTTTTNAAIGATVLALEATNGFSASDKIGVMLDNGTLFLTSQVGAAAANGITIANPLPYTVQSGNDVISYGAVGP